MKVEIVEKLLTKPSENRFKEVEKIVRTVEVDGEEFYTETVTPEMRRSTPVGVFMDWVLFGRHSKESTNSGEAG